jgi:hypothetical protein
VEVGNSAGENREARSINIGGFQFRWSSEWNVGGAKSPAQEKKRCCICREVQNDSSKPLYYTWPLAGDFSNEGLPPHETGSVV